MEKDVCDLMIKSLKYCDTETDKARLPTCQYRAAIIHHRLASLYHNSYRNQVSEIHLLLEAHLWCIHTLCVRYWDRDRDRNQNQNNAMGDNRCQPCPCSGVVWMVLHKTYNPFVHVLVPVRGNRICLQSPPDKYIPVLLQLTDQKKRHLRTLAEMHYNKAVRFFTLVDSSVEILRAQLERVALAEFQLNSEWSFFTARQRSCEKVMFSYVSVQSDCRGGSPCDHC